MTDSTLSANVFESAPTSRCRRWSRRKAVRVGAVMLAALAGGVTETWAGLGRRPTGERLERMKRSPLWRDGRFRSPQPLWNNFSKALLAAFHSDPNASPSSSVPAMKVDPAKFQTPPESGLRITWLGHSTTLIEIDGVRILTDPVWGEHASPVAWAGVRRWYAPPLALAGLPALDAIVISHDHYDHMDHQTIVALKDMKTTFIVPLGVGAHLAFWGVPESRIVELDWWESTRVGAVEITSTPARHASGRGFLDHNLTLWSGYAFNGPKHRVYFSGDTGMQDAFAEIALRLGPFDATLIEIGEYNANWPDWHIGPEQAIAAHKMVQGKVFIPIHWGLFKLAPHGWTEPVERVLVAARRDGVTVATPRPGESVEPGITLITKRWWPELPWSPADKTPIISTQDGKLRSA